EGSGKRMNFSLLKKKMPSLVGSLDVVEAPEELVRCLIQGLWFYEADRLLQHFEKNRKKAIGLAHEHGTNISNIYIRSIICVPNNNRVRL
ncbi:hypothetical protein ACJX0J_022177, partial [Zea mays]